jgi:hypothetical protein
MQSLPDYGANFTGRAQQYRERAWLLRAAAEILSPAQRDDLLEEAQELEELADIIERLRFGDR